MSGDPFTVLGLSSNATKDQVKASYRKLALLYHPDRHAASSSAEQAAAAKRFQAATDAYDSLTDDSKRQAYASSRRSAASTQQQQYGASTSQQQYGFSDHARSSYRHDYSAHQRVRMSTWQMFIRAAGARKVEAGLAVMLFGVMVLGVSSVDKIWAWRNQGKRFVDISGGFGSPPLPPVRRRHSHGGVLRTSSPVADSAELAEPAA